MNPSTYSETANGGQQGLAPADLRLKLLANGYVPTPNLGKMPLLKGWPTVKVDETVIASWSRRHKRLPDTGIRLEDDLCVIDLDVDDQVMEEIVTAIEHALPTLASSLLRHGKGYKEAWFLRCPEPVGHLNTRRWCAPGTTEDDGRIGAVEIFGRGERRQFGSFGAHTRSEDEKEILIAYRWEGPSPLDVPYAKLPEVEKADLWKVLDIAEDVLERHGWTPVLRTKKGESSKERLYDLTDDMTFDCDDGVTRTLAELQAAASPKGGLRCSASFMEGASAVNRERCLVSTTQSGVVTVHETAAGETHMPVSAAPPEPLDKKIELDMAVVAERLARLQEHESENKTRRRLELRPGTDTLEQAAAKLVQSYALCPTRQLPVVPIYTDDASAGLSMANFRMMVAPFSEPAKGVDGQPLKTRISPADMWVNSDQRSTVAGLRMRPDKPRPTYKEGSETFINVYRPAVHPAVGGDPWGGIALLEQIVPDPVERVWLRQWTAYKYLNPGTPGPAVLMVARDAFGTGRSTWGDLLKLVFGARHVNTISFDHFAGRTTQAQYTAWQADSLLVLVNESSTADNGSNYRTKHDTYERLKEIVDPRPQERLIHDKYVKAYRAQVCASYCIFTNNPDALPLPAGDRRFAVLTNGGQREPAFWEGLNAWMQDAANVGAFVRWLEATDLTGYSPYAMPPMTEAKAAMTELSQSDLDRALADALALLPAGAFTPEHIMQAMHQAKTVSGYDFPADRVDQLMRKIIQRVCHRVGVRQGANWWFSHDGKRMAVYARTAAEAKKWTRADQEQLRREILRNGVPGAVMQTLGTKLQIAVDNTQNQVHAPSKR